MSVLVTGAASGIGAALVDRLGPAALTLDRHAADLVCDLSDAAAIAALREQVREPLDGIALVAGLPGTRPAEAVLAVNGFAPQRLIAALAGQLRPGASVVIVSSVTALRCDRSVADLDAMLEADAPDAAALELPGVRAYELSKALANRTVVREAARLIGGGIRVNGVSPGPVETPILDDFRTSMGADRIAVAHGMVGRHGRADEIAAGIVFLLSDAASWVNGADLRMDGGYHAVRAAGQAA